MRKVILFFCLIAGISISALSQSQSLSYSIASKPWQTGLGNHRAVLLIDKPSDAIRLQITWRLHDQQPDKKRFLIVNATTGDTIHNVYKIEVNNEQCDIVFGPVIQPGRYYFYYMPFKPDPAPGYYRYGYLPSEKADESWVNDNHLSASSTLSKLPKAACKEIQARTAFDSFFPMEVIPTHAEKIFFYPNIRTIIFFFLKTESCLSG